MARYPKKKMVQSAFILLIFRRKEDDAYLIENTTESGNKLAEQVLSSNKKSFKDLEQYISICLKSCKESSIELRKENLELSNSLALGEHDQNPELN